MSQSHAPAASATAKVATTQIRMEVASKSQGLCGRRTRQQPILVESWNMPKKVTQDWHSTLTSLAVATNHEGMHPDLVQRLAPMSRGEEAVACVMFFLLLGFMIWGVPVLTIFAFLYPSTGAIVISILLCSTCADSKFWKRTLRSSFAQLLLKYFSLKIIWKTGNSK